jgi:hypothetical protein
VGGSFRAAKIRTGNQTNLNNPVEKITGGAL